MLWHPFLIGYLVAEAKRDFAIACMRFPHATSMRKTAGGHQDPGTMAPARHPENAWNG
jgi:hypothetical protein